MCGWPVSRILFRGLHPFDDHSSARTVTGAGQAANPGPGMKRPCGSILADLRARGPYSALLRVGLAVPGLLPALRWALPHRFTIATGEPVAVSSLWRFPLGYPSRALPGTLASWSPDFPRSCCQSRGRPAIRTRAAYALQGRASIGTAEPVSLSRGGKVDGGVIQHHGDQVEKPHVRGREYTASRPADSPEAA